MRSSARHTHAKLSQNRLGFVLSRPTYILYTATFFWLVRKSVRCNTSPKERKRETGSIQEQEQENNASARAALMRTLQREDPMTEEKGTVEGRGSERRTLADEVHSEPCNQQRLSLAKCAAQGCYIAWSTRWAWSRKSRRPCRDRSQLHPGDRRDGQSSVVRTCSFS